MRTLNTLNVKDDINIVLGGNTPFDDYVYNSKNSIDKRYNNMPISHIEYIKDSKTLYITIAQLYMVKMLIEGIKHIEFVTAENKSAMYNIIFDKYRNCDYGIIGTYYYNGTQFVETC